MYLIRCIYSCWFISVTEGFCCRYAVHVLILVVLYVCMSVFFGLKQKHLKGGDWFCPDCLEEKEGVTEEEEALEAAKQRSKVSQ